MVSARELGSTRLRERCGGPLLRNRRIAGLGRPRALASNIRRRPGFRCGCSLALQDPRPFELDPGVQLLDEANRVFVERCPAHLDSRRGPEPIEDARPRTPAPAIGIDDEGVLVTALVAIEPQIRQNYFLFFTGRAGAALRAGALRAAATATLRTGAGFFFAATALAVRTGTIAFFGAFAARAA